MFNNLAGILCQLHRYPEAEKVARQALAKHPYSFKASYLLEDALVSQGKWSDEAKRKLEFAAVTRAEAKQVLASWPKQGADVREAR